MSQTTHAAGVNSQRIIEEYRRILGEGNGRDLDRLNSIGVKRFGELGFPHAKHEMFTFVDTWAIAESGLTARRESIDIHEALRSEMVAPESEQSHISLIDGVYYPERSNTSGVAYDLNAARLDKAISADVQIEAHLYGETAKDDDAFASLNAAFATSGVHIDIKDGASLTSPLQLLVITTGYDGVNGLTSPRALINVGRNATATILITQAGAGERYFNNLVVDLRVGEGSTVTCYHVNRESPGSVSFTKLRARQSCDSKVSLIGVTGGSKLSRTHLDWSLRGEGAQLEVKNLTVLTGALQAHHYSRIRHEVPDCKSDLLFKNIVTDTARVSTDSTVIVLPGAHGSDSHLLVNNLMMSDKARADNKPNLMIHNEDVKCSHGATIGQVDDDQLLYLTSRGLDRRAAVAMLTRGFARAVSGAVALGSLSKHIDESLLEQLEGR